MRNTLAIVLFLFTGLLHGQNPGYPENFGDLFKSDKHLLGKNIFKGDVGYSFSRISFRDTSQTLTEFFRHAVKINFNINPWGDFYLKNTFYIDLNAYDIAPPWLSNYFYQIGYYNWRNKSFSFGYENYQPNQWKELKDHFWTNLKRGYLFVSYNYIIETPEHKKDMKPLFWDKTSRVAIVPFLKIHPEYPDQDNNFGGYLKPVLGSNIRYVIIQNIYLEAGLNYYPISETKLPWDADFTYGFGIFDWRAFKLNFSYGNWIANRFPWNMNELDYHNFMNGEFVLNFTYSW